MKKVVGSIILFVLILGGEPGILVAEKVRADSATNYGVGISTPSPKKTNIELSNYVP